MQNIVDKEAEVIVRTTDGFSGVERVVVGSAGMCIDLEEAAPPSIADMAPGTTCDANGCNARPRWISAGGFHWCDEHKPFPSWPLAPSTIRDVTPPRN